MADQRVFIVAQRAAGFEQPDVRPKDVPHLAGGEVVDGQAGNDVVVDPFAWQIFHGGVEDLHLAGAITEAPLVFETVTDEGHEVRIDLNGVEAVAGK